MGSAGRNEVGVVERLVRMAVQERRVVRWVRWVVRVWDAGVRGLGFVVVVV